MNAPHHRYFLINKPCNIVSQFVSADKVGLLGDLDFDFPEGTHAIGRLDSHSEGLLLLTTNKKVTRLLFQGKIPHARSYVVLVRNIVTEATVQQLRNGIPIRVQANMYYTTTPCEVAIIEKPQSLHADVYEHREKGPHTWLQITLTEGKYHQVRKMATAIGHPCKRLIRVSIEDLVLGDMQAGEVREIAEDDFFDKLKIDDWRDG